MNMTGAGLTITGVMILLTVAAGKWGKINWGPACWFLALGILLGTSTLGLFVSRQVNTQVPSITHTVDKGVTGLTGGGSGGGH